MKWTLRILIASFILTGLIVALWWEENWRGQKLWEESCARLRAAGEPVEIADIIPPVIPDEENVAKVPIFAELFGSPDPSRLSQVTDFLTLDRVGDPTQGARGMVLGSSALVEKHRDALRELFPSDAPDKSMTAADEVLHYLKKWDTEYEEILSALQRPGCRWPLDYENGVKMTPPHFIPLMRVTNFMRVRLLALAAKGNAEEYTRCLLGMMKLERTVGARPESWLAQLVSNGMATTTFNSWHQSVSCVHLNEQQIRSLQSQASKYSLESVRLAMQNERVISTETFRNLSTGEMVDWMDELNWRPSPTWEQTGSIEYGVFRTGMLLRPQGWTLAEAALGQDFAFQEQAPCVDATRGIIHVSMVDAAMVKAEALKQSLSWFSMGRHAQNPDIFLNLSIVTARVHAHARMAILGCAIDRYRLRHGKLPASTSELVPEFLTALPGDVMDGGAIRFNAHGNEGYVLHSTAWHGGPGRELSGINLTQDHWTWGSSPDLLKSKSQFDDPSNPSSAAGD